MRFGSVLSLFATCAVGLAQSPWTVVEIPGNANTVFDRIVFVNDRVGWLTSFDQILKTTDSGRTWSVLQPRLLAGGLWFADERHGWAAGTVDQQAAILETSDGGDSWKMVQSWPRVEGDSGGGAMLDIQFADAMHGWAVGFNHVKAMIVATTDGGRHWTTQYSGAEIDGQFSEVRCEDASNCWVLGPNGVMGTEDGGESWRLAYSDGGLLTDIDVVDHSNVWVGGAWGELVHGTRGGFRWRGVPLGRDDFSEYIKFVDVRRGWAVLNKERIIVTRDGGKTWVRESLSIGKNLRPCSMSATGSTLYVIANPGHLLMRTIR